MLYFAVAWIQAIDAELPLIWKWKIKCAQRFYKLFKMEGKQVKEGKYHTTVIPVLPVLSHVD